MASKRNMKCAGCKEGKPKLTMIENGLLYCTQCVEQINQEDVGIKNEPYHDDTIAQIKEEPKMVDCFEDIVTPFSKHTAVNHIKNEITIEEPDSNIIRKTNKSKKKERQPICGYCGVDCETNVEYKTHIKAYHSEERILFCGVCHVTSKGETLYRKHIQEKHNGFESICKICLELGQAKNYINHKKRCLGRMLFQCKLCKDLYGKKASLLSHLDGHSIPEESKKSSFVECRIKEQFFDCKICEDDKAYKQRSYWKHIKEAHQGYHLRCKYCPRTFRSRGFQSRHIYSDCKARPVAPDSVNLQSKCPECSRVFDTKIKLSRHRKAEHPTKPLKCNICGMEFEKSSPYRYHRLVAHTEPKYNCPVCQKKFHYPLAFQRHTKTHQYETENHQLVEGSKEPVGHDESTEQIKHETETFDGADRTSQTESTEQSDRSVEFKVKKEIDSTGNIEECNSSAGVY